MLARQHELAWLQSDFYRNQFRKVLRWLIVVTFIMFLLIGSIIYVILIQPSPKYYANTSEGRILPMPMS